MRKTDERKKFVSSEKRQLVEELHAPARKNFPRRRVIVRGYDDLWQADIVEMRPYSRFNRGYHYILTVIDVLSKHAWAVPLKNKSGKEVTQAFAGIFRERYPKNLQTDKGKEFYNSDVQRLVTKHGINHYSTYSVMKASVVERFNRTLKNEMWKQFTLNGTYRWIDELPHLMSRYNGRKHRTIGMRPVDVTPAIAEKLLRTVYSNVKIAGPAKFKVGDSVRVSKFKTIFEKGYTPNWITEVFKITKIQTTNPVTYLLEDSRGKPIAGGIYEHELHRVANSDVYLVEKVLRKQGNKVYVKWLGFDNSHNSWINKDNVL
jgi:transposase InsO family protein